MSTAFIGANHFITVARAKFLISQYNSQKDQILKPDFLGREILPLSETFDRLAFDTVLNKPNCAGLRAYLGMDEDLKIRIIVVAVDQAGRDILSMSTTNTEADPDSLESSDPNDEEVDEEVIEQGVRCPPFCPTP